jgi:hypothetical protein
MLSGSSKRTQAQGETPRPTLIHLQAESNGNDFFLRLLFFSRGGKSMGLLF